MPGADPRRPPALARHGDDGRLTRRGRCGRVAGGAGEPRLPRAEPGPPPLPLRGRAVPPPGQPAPAAGRIRESPSELSPADFALVMATGIASIALRLEGLATMSLALYWRNLVSYAALWALYLARLCLAPGRFLADLKDHDRAVGFFTAAAGTCVLETQFVLIVSDTRAAVALWFVLRCGLRSDRPEQPRLINLGVVGPKRATRLAVRRLGRRPHKVGVLSARSTVRYLREKAHLDPVAIARHTDGGAGGLSAAWMNGRLGYRSDSLLRGFNRRPVARRIRRNTASRAGAARGRSRPAPAPRRRPGGPSGDSRPGRSRIGAEVLGGREGPPGS